jgi:undecaprenyl pyrophosphate synthase
MNNVLKHIGLIPDGNRRWAKMNSMKISYKNGFEKIKEITEFLNSIDEITNISYFLLAKNNSKREDIKEHLKDLENVSFDYFYKYKVEIFGDVDELEVEVKNKIYDLSSKCNKESNKQLNLFINYSFESELSKFINYENFLKNGSGKLKQMDLLIRTGNCNRISDFCLFLLKYTEIYFEKSLWPEFSLDKLNDYLIMFKKTYRSFGE